MGIMKDVWWTWYYLSLRAPQQVLLFLKDTIHSFKELYTLLWNPAKKIDNSALKIAAITLCELTLKTETLHITGLMSGASVAPSQLISQCVFRSHFTGSCSWKWVGTICGKRDALPTNDETLNSCFSVYFSLMSPWSKRNIWNMTVNICISYHLSGCLMSIQTIWQRTRFSPPWLEPMQGVILHCTFYTLKIIF